MLKLTLWVIGLSLAAVVGYYGMIVIAMIGGGG